MKKRSNNILKKSLSYKISYEVFMNEYRKILHKAS